MPLQNPLGPIASRGGSVPVFLRKPIATLDFPGLEVIKLEYSLKLKIKLNDGCLRTHLRKQPIIVLYFEFENEIMFYNLEARGLDPLPTPLDLPMPCLTFKSR